MNRLLTCLRRTIRARQTPSSNHTGFSARLEGAGDENVQTQSAGLAGQRVVAFVTVGAIGFVLQIGIVAVLSRIAHWPVAAATALGVEAAVLHNFVWHERWTWADRHARASGAAPRLMRFHLTNGATSVGGSVAITIAAMHVLAIDAVVANIVAVAAMSAAS